MLREALLTSLLNATITFAKRLVEWKGGHSKSGRGVNPVDYLLGTSEVIDG